MGTGGKVTVGLYMLSALSVIMGIKVTFQHPVYEVARDDPVDLTCTFQTKIPNSNIIVVSWSADADDPREPQISIGTFYYPSKVDISADYKGRATMTNDVQSTSGVSTLSFSHVTMQENRVFQCKVQIPGDNDGEPSDTTQLVVLVAPSVPVCKVQGTAEYGHNISLTCKSEEGSPAPTYKWQRFDPMNNPKPFPPRTIENNGVLSLFNVSMETSGYYICTATNKIRSVSYNMTLSVMPPSMSIGSTAIIAVAIVAVVVVLLIIVYCCCCRKKKKTTADYEEEGPAAFHDKPPLEMKLKSDGIQYEESREDDHKQSIDQELDDRNDNYSSNTDDRQGKYRYDDRNEGTRSRSREQLDRYDDSRSRSNDRLDRYDDARSRSSDRLDRYDDNRGRLNDRLDRCDDRHGRSNDRLDRYDDSRSRSNDRLDRYDDSRSRSSDRLDRYDDNRSRSSDRLDRYEGSRDRYDDRQGRYEDRRDHYSDRYEDNRTHCDDRR